jgi:glycosyltransferase involved in cell wall biosynthesis
VITGRQQPANPTVRTLPTLSIVVPVYDEVACLDTLVRELGAVLDGIGQPAEIIAVDDGSTDGSFARLVALRDAEPRLRVARLQRNYGQTAALAAGIELARGEVIVSLDADLQNDPRDIPALLAALHDDVDVVNGWRRVRQDPWLTRRLPSQIANRIISLVTGTSLHDYGCTLRAMRAPVAKELKLYGELHRFIPALAADLGARVAELPVTHRRRTQGRSKYGLSRTVRVVLDLLTVKFLSGYATRPLHLFGLVGLALAVPGTALIAALGFERLVLGVRLADRPIVLLAILLTVLGVQFVSIGLLGEMMVRTYHESQGKPIFRIRDIVEEGAPELTSRGPAANPAAL